MEVELPAQLVLRGQSVGRRAQYLPYGILAQVGFIYSGIRVVYTGGKFSDKFMDIPPNLLGIKNINILQLQFSCKQSSSMYPPP